MIEKRQFLGDKCYLCMDFGCVFFSLIYLFYNMLGVVRGGWFVKCSLFNLFLISFLGAAFHLFLILV